MGQLFYRLIILAGLCSSAISSAAPYQYDILSPRARLRRVSLLLRDQIPTAAEFNELRLTPAHDVDALIKSKVRLYMDEHFNIKMVSNLSNLFRIKSPTDDSSKSGSLHELFYRIVANNLPWDELLTSSDIMLGAQSSNIQTNAEFFMPAATDADTKKILLDYLETTRLKAIRAEIYKSNSSDESKKLGVTPVMNLNTPQVAGVLSDPSFVTRYTNTPINQNRKRAAAIFRIFLCDEMQAVVLPDETALREIENIGLDPENNAPKPTVQAHTDLHASDPKCKSCHFKLDPLAQVFKGVSTTLPNRPTAGSLTFKRHSGELVKVPFRNAQELAQALVRQPEYVSCQVRHFWDWFVGSDVVMDLKTEQDLIRVFESSGRRPKSFIAEILARKESYMFPRLTVDQIGFRHVSSLLNSCNTCHSNQSDAPDFAQIPFSVFGDGSQHALILSKMVDALDLNGDGAKSTMPPASAGWKVASADRARLLAWLALGAPDDSGKPTWNDSNLQEKLRKRTQAEGLSFTLSPTFGFTAKRWMSPYTYNLSLISLLLDLGIPLGDTKFYDYRVQTTRLDTGISLKDPNAKYIEAVDSSSNIFMYKIQKNFDQVQRLLNLDPAADRMDTAIKISTFINGKAPEVGSQEYERLQVLADSMKNTYFELAASSIFKQIVITNKFLIY